MLDKKAFYIVVRTVEITVFIVTYNNQDLVHYIHCFQYTLCHQNKTMNF